MGGGSPTLNQQHFQFQDDGADANTSTLLGAEDAANTGLSLDTTYFARIKISNTGAMGINNAVWELQYNVAGAGWNNVTTTSSNVRAVAGSDTDGDVMSTERLTNDGGAYSNGVYEESGLTGALSLSNGDETELVYSIQFRSADLTVGSEEIDLRIVHDGATLLDNYNITVEATMPAGSTTITMGLVTETDVAQPISVAKAKAFGLVTETDAALAMVVSKTRAIGQASETDAAFAFTSAKTRSIGLVTETDLAQPMTVAGAIVVAIGLTAETDLAQPMTSAKQKAIGLTAETDVALDMSSAKLKALGLAVETDLAQPISVVAPILVPVGLVTETDLAQPMGSAKQKALGLSTETDVALAMTSAKLKAIGLTFETDLAQPISVAGEIIVPMGLTAETDLAQPIASSKLKAFSLVTETDLAPGTTAAKLKALGHAVETDLAQPMTVAGPIIIPLGLVQEIDAALAMTVDAGQIVPDKMADPGSARQRPTTPVRPRQFHAKKWNMFFETFDAYLRRQETLVQSAALTEETVDEAVQAVIEEREYREGLGTVRNVILERMELSAAEVDHAMQVTLEETVQVVREQESARLTQDERDILSLVALAVSSGHIHR